MSGSIHGSSSSSSSNITFLENKVKQHLTEFANAIDVYSAAITNPNNTNTDDFNSPGSNTFGTSSSVNMKVNAQKVQKFRDYLNGLKKDYARVSREYKEKQQMDMLIGNPSQFSPGSGKDQLKEQAVKQIGAREIL